MNIEITDTLLESYIKIFNRKIKLLFGLNIYNIPFWDI